MDNMHTWTREHMEVVSYRALGLQAYIETRKERIGVLESAQFVTQVHQKVLEFRRRCAKWTENVYNKLKESNSSYSLVALTELRSTALALGQNVEQRTFVDLCDIINSFQVWESRILSVARPDVCHIDEIILTLRDGEGFKLKEMPSIKAYTLIIKKLRIVEDWIKRCEFLFFQTSGIRWVTRSVMDRFNDPTNLGPVTQMDDTLFGILRKSLDPNSIRHVHAKRMQVIRLDVAEDLNAVQCQICTRPCKTARKHKRHICRQCCLTDRPSIADVAKLVSRGVKIGIEFPELTFMRRLVETATAWQAFARKAVADTKNGMLTPEKDVSDSVLLLEGDLLEVSMPEEFQLYDDLAQRWGLFIRIPLSQAEDHKPKKAGELKPSSGSVTPKRSRMMLGDTGEKIGKPRGRPKGSTNKFKKVKGADGAPKSKK